MKFKIFKNDLLKATDTLVKVVPNNPVLPVISLVLFEIDKSILSLTATNLEFGIKIKLPVKSEEESNIRVKVAIPISTVNKFLKFIKDQDFVELDLQKNFIEIKTQTDDVKVRVQEAEEFPELPKIQDTNTKIIINPNKIIEGITSVSFAASTNTVKPELSSVYIYKEEGNLIFVSTDQFRLAEKRVKLDSGVDFNPSIIPIKNAQEIKNILSNIDSDIEIYPEEDQFIIASENLYVYSRVINSSFPNYKAILPKEYINETVLLKEDFEQAIQKISIFSDQFGKIKLKTIPKEGKLEFYSENQNLGESKTSIKCKSEGEELELFFNYKYLQDTLSSLKSDSIKLSFSGSVSPLIITPALSDDYKYLVMPMTG